MKKIAIFMSVLMLSASLLSCADIANIGDDQTDEVASTTAAVTTVDPGKLTNPNLTDIEKEIITAMWKNYPILASLTNSINDLSVGEFFVPCGTGYVLWVTDGKASANSLYRVIIAGYDFRYSSVNPLDLYLNGEFCLLHEAYTSGKITADDVKSVWEAYRNAYPTRYEGESGVLYDATEAEVY